MQKFNVHGMSCAACVARVESAVNKVPGVSSCAVSLLTSSMNVEGTAKNSDIVFAVKKAGYKATAANEAAEESNLLEDTETPIIKKRLIASLIFLLPLLYFSMGHMMLSLPLPSMSHFAMGLVQLVLAGAVLLINNKFFVNGLRGLLHRAPNMDSLVAIGAGTSYLYSIVVLCNSSNAKMPDLYFEGAATIVTLITVGKLLEAISKGKTTSALKSLMDLAPKQATVFDGVEKVVPIEQVKVGDIFIVKPGESIPVDGIVVEGGSAVNESALTGESLPIDKCVGSAVTSATLNQSGYLRCRATRVGKDSTISQIIKLVGDASATKAPIAKIADRVAGIFVPAVICIAIITFVAWFVAGAEFGFSLARAITVLVISCPCALGLATPVAIMVGSGVGARHGILFKTSAALETTGRTQIVALDKTGTITCGEPKVTDVVLAGSNVVQAGSTEREELLNVAKSIECKSEHPLAKAILSYSEGYANYTVENFEALPGNGLSATIDSEQVFAGSLMFVKNKVNVPNDIEGIANELANNGKTPLLFAKGGTLLGIIAVADTLKDDSVKAIEELRGMGIHVVMLTGDNERTANAIAKLANVDEVVAGVLPSGKESVIKKFMEHGYVTMVGDGINDAPALTRANVGIAIGAGADIAIDAANVVLMKSSLSDVPMAIRLSRATIRNIHQNLFFAFIYNCLGIPLAAGCYYKLFGWSLNATFAALAMSLSSFCVVTNALRLNFANIKNMGNSFNLKNKVTHKIIQASNEGKQMKKTYSVEGMMCPHCEANVKKTLEALPGVVEAKPSHKSNSVEVTFSDTVNDSAIKDAIVNAGYEFKG